MEIDYSKFLIKTYKYWRVSIYENQGYLGRCIVWCLREDALDLTEATDDERAELFIVLKELKNALKVSFNPDWFNYAFLGNGVRHLHAHFIPRYEKPREFMSVTFEDKRYGYNYKTDHDFIISEELLMKIKKLLQKNLN